MRSRPACLGFFEIFGEKSFFEKNLRHVLGVCKKAAHLRPLPTTSYGALMEDHAADLLRYLVEAGFIDAETDDLLRPSQ